MRDKVLDVVRSEDNCVTFNNGEFEITGRKLREKLVPKPKIPKRKVVKDKEGKKEEGEKTERGECL